MLMNIWRIAMVYSELVVKWTGIEAVNEQLEITALSQDKHYNIKSFIWSNLYTHFLLEMYLVFVLRFTAIEI
jgi:hypothetical protein